MATRKRDHGVRHNPAAHRFELDTPAGLAVADYRLSGGTMTIYHTEVPAPVRGRTFGYRLVCGALQEVRRLDLSPSPSEVPSQPRSRRRGRSP
jgi:predicted GNAT family acetyltransferase